MDEIMKIAKKHGLFVVEDTAQAFGGEFKGKKLGTIGDLGCYSLSPHKIISTGQGGLIVTKDPVLHSRIRKLKDFGREVPGSDDHDSFGINAKFTDLQAVIGIEQLKDIGRRIEIKRHIFDVYRQQLTDNVDTVETNLEDTVPWFMDIYTEKRDELAEFLDEWGIGTRKMYKVLYKQGAYKQTYNYYHTSAESYSNRRLFLPSSVDLSDDDIEFVCRKVGEFFI